MIVLVTSIPVMPGIAVALLALAAGFVTLGNLAVIRAYRIGEMSVVSPFRYTVILTSLAVGYEADLHFLGSGLGEVVPYAVMILVLLVRPSGLFGRKEAVRV